MVQEALVVRLEIKNEGEIDKILQAISDVYRVRALMLLNEKKEPKEVAKLIGRSRSGVQRYIDGFRKARLLTTEDNELTLRGKKVIREYLNFTRNLDTILDELIQTEIRERIKTNLKEHMVRFGSGLTKEDVAKLLEELEKEQPK